jgi:iron(III) transport system substrate-binding protein
MLRGMTMGGMRQGWWPRAALLVGAVIFGGACAPAVPAQPTAPAQAVAQVQPAPPSAESLDALYAAAQKEGQLTIYSTLNTQFGQPLVDKFTQRYPGIKINYNRQQAEKLTQIMQQEAAAGKMTWDVVEGPEDAFFGYVQSQYVQAYVSPSAASFPGELKDAAGMWTSDRVNPQSLVVNTDQVKQEEMPKTWTDMDDSRWKGRMAIDGTNVLLYAAMKDQWGAQKAGDYLRGIAANQPRLESSNTTIAQLLGAGEFSAAVGIYTDAAHALQQQGAPIKVIGADPVFVQLQLVGLGAQAPDANAAKLFISWLLGDEGQAGLDAVGVVPARPDKYQAATAFIGAPSTVIISPTLAAKAPELTGEFNQILGIK